MELIEKLLKIQTELKAPKNQYNEFSNFYYRSCEDILNGLKPLLEREKVFMTMGDEVFIFGDRYYIKSTVTLIDAENSEDKLSVSGYAREDNQNPKMNGSQTTGTASTYARKYALNGLFLIDDSKDPDSINFEKTNNKIRKTKEDVIKDINKLDKEKRKKVLEHYGINRVEDMTQEQLKDYLNRLKQKKSK